MFEKLKNVVVWVGVLFFLGSLVGLVKSSWAADLEETGDGVSETTGNVPVPPPTSQEGEGSKGDSGEVIEENKGFLKQLTNHRTITARPSWSPDGSKIAFHSIRKWDMEGEDEDKKKKEKDERRVNRDIWVMDWDGTNLKHLTTSNADEYNAVFSPGGKRIVYISEENGNRDIWIMNADGTSKAPLTLDKGMEQDPAWSPDGSMVAFSALRLQRGGNFDIWIMGSDGSNPRRLTKMGGNEAAPNWHPDGKHISFHSDDGGNLDIYTVDIKGKKLLRTIRSSDQESRPVFSSDGTKIAYNSWGKDQPEDQTEVWIANIDGSDPYKLTHGPPNRNPRWSPDCTQLVFQSKRTGFWEIWVQEVPLDVLRSGKFAYVGMVRGGEGFDLLRLRNGDSLTGMVLNPEITLRSSYSELSFPRELLATLRFPEGRQGIGEVIALNGDKFSGFLLENNLKFRLQQGAVMDIRKEKVDTVGFGYYAGEPQKFPDSPRITLRNGDIFAGSLLNPQLVIKTSYGDVPLDLMEVAKIENRGIEKVIARVTLVNGDVLQGELEEDDIRVDLDVGLVLDIYKDWFLTINMNRRIKLHEKVQSRAKIEVGVQEGEGEQAEEAGVQGEEDEQTKLDGPD